MRCQMRSGVPSRYRPDDDAGSMAVYLILAIVGMALGALIVPMIITSSQNTRSDTSRVHALDAAQAGLNVMLGQIRAAKRPEVGTSGEVGDSQLLPCASTSGLVNGVGPASYEVSIDYYMVDPVATPNAQKMTCAVGSGTYDPVSTNVTPRFARITSIGRDGTPSNGSTRGRTLKATYVFRTTNSNIAGGRIRIYPGSSTSPELCMDAGQASPSAGALVTLKACATPDKPQQMFAYRSDLTLQLLSSITGTYPNGLCLDTAPPPTRTAGVILNACGVLGTPARYTQQWSFNDQGGYQASLSTSATTAPPPGGTNLSGQCIGVATPSAGAPLVLANCSEGYTRSPTQAWIPSPKVGAGAAEAPQLVNFAEFGRCLDVTDQDVTSDHLIDYPCKQNPYPGAVAWNQKFTMPPIAADATSGTGQIYTTLSGTRYCLTSPSTSGGYVTVIVCSGSNARQVWTTYNGKSPLPFAMQYTIVNNTGQCLGLTGPSGSEQWSAIVVEPCSRASEYKWNAPPNLASSVLQDIDEVVTTP